MRTYETTFIINPQSDDSAIDQHVKAVTDLIAENGGSILRENRIGTRRLAYDIQKLGQGYFTDLIFEGPKEILDVLDRFYKLQEPYIRHLVVRFEGELPLEQPQVPSGTDEDKEDKKEDKEEDKKEEVKVQAPEPVAEVKAEAEPEPTEDTQPIETVATETAPVETEPVVVDTAVEPPPTEEPSTEPEKRIGDDDIL